MEGELGDSERGLSSLIENVPGIVYRCEFDRDWTMRYLSESCSDITGYEPSELIDNEKLSWAEIIHPEDRERVWEEISESLEESEQFQLTYRIITIEDEERWVWEQGTAHKDREDSIEGLEGFISDITEEIKEHKKLKEREKKLKELYEASTKLASSRTKQEVYELAIQWAEKILNFYSCALYMEETGELEVKFSLDQSSFEKGDTYSLEREGLMSYSFKNKEGVLADDFESRGIEVTQEGLKSGISVPIGDIGLLAASSKEKNYFDEFDLKMANILASHVKEAIERIDEQKEKSLILETAEENILYFDTDLNIKWANLGSKERAKYVDDELIGEKCHEVFWEKDESCEDCPVVRTIGSGEREEGIRKNENGNYWLIKATPRLDEDGEVEGVVEIALDITKRKQSEEKLKENKEKIEGLLKATSQLERQHDIDDIFEVAIDAIENILKIDFGAIFVLEDDKFVLKAETSGTPLHDLQVREKDEGMLGKTFRTKEPDITDDLQSSENANLHFEVYKSGISVPIGDFGVFQAMSKEKGQFDKDDLHMLELLSNHISEARKRVKLHEKLERSEKRYRNLFEESPISLWEEDFSEVKRYLDDLKESGVEDFRKYFNENPKELRKCIEKVKINDINKVTLELFGAERKEELFENFDSILRGESREGLINELVAIANDEQTFQTSEFVNYTLDGEKRYCFLKWTVTSEEGDFSEVIVSLVDITRMKETQKKLERSEKKYRSIFESTGTAMAMINKDKTISLVNEKFTKLTGFSKEDIEGKAKWPKFLPEDEREKMESYHQKRREDPETVPSSYEFTGINRFGDARDVVLEAGLIPETEKTVASLMDITKYKKTFGALRESQEAFRLLFENIDDPVILIDKNKEIKDMNSSFREMSEFDEEKIIGKSYKEFLGGKNDIDLSEKLEETFAGKVDGFESDILFVTGDEREVPINIECRLVRDPEENPLYVIGIIRSE